MPVTLGDSGRGGSPDGVKKLEAEVNRLKQQVESLRRQVDGDGGRGGSAMAWITTALAAFGALLGLVAMFRH